MASKHWQSVLDAAQESIDQFSNQIIGERIDVVLMRVQKKSPKTYRRWLKNAGAKDLPHLTEIVRMIVYQSEADNEIEGTKDKPDEPRAGQGDRKAEGDTTGDQPE